MRQINARQVRQNLSKHLCATNRNLKSRKLREYNNRIEDKVVYAVSIFYYKIKICDSFDAQ